MLDAENRLLVTRQEHIMSKSMKGSSVLQPLLGSLLKCDLRTALRQIHSLPVPTTNDLDAWSAYWKAHNQPWRTEPEIDTKRQKELVARCTIIPDIKHGIYPFTGMKLNRADIEWLLGSHENGCGPVNHGDESQWKHNELDLRDADLRGQDLHNLPLMHMLGSLRWQEWAYTTPEQREAAVVHLEGANLSYTHLEKANLRGAHLERANLYAAHLEGTGLYAAHLEGANLKQAFFDSSTQLRKSILGNKTIGSALLADVRWGDVDVTGINWTTIAVLGDERRAQLLKRGTKDKKSLLAACRREQSRSPSSLCGRPGILSDTGKADRREGSCRENGDGASGPMTRQYAVGIPYLTNPALYPG
jgi:uncharacterized protein YjbI with pentapeptide repeats